MGSGVWEIVCWGKRRDKSLFDSYLFMRRDFSTFPYEYQGMKIDHDEYIRYLGRLDKLLKNEVQNMDQFSDNFIQFGISRLFWIEDTKITVAI